MFSWRSRFDASGAFDEMVGKVETFGGDIMELGRSAFVAAFGLDVVEDGPVRAALAALVMLKARERAKSDDGAESHAKIVVHVAQVLVGQHQGVPTIDLESKRSAWATIEALTGLDQFETVVVSEAAAPFLERRFELTPASPRDARASLAEHRTILRTLEARDPRAAAEAMTAHIEGSVVKLGVKLGLTDDSRDGKTTSR